MKVNVKGRCFFSSEIASLHVDPQCGFSELCPKELPVPGALEIVPELKAQAEYATINSASGDAHSDKSEWAATAEHPQLSPILSQDDMDLYWNIHCVPGTLGFKFLPGLHRRDYDFIAYKGVEPNMHPYGALYRDLADTLSTGLLEFYLAKGVKVVIVGGLATSWCLKKTVLQLCATKKFVVYVNLAACRDIPGSDTQGSIDEMETAGAIMLESSNEIEMVNEH
jgi:nicotinamidase/pyrazinamidase